MLRQCTSLRYLESLDSQGPPFGSRSSCPTVSYCQTIADLHATPNSAVPAAQAQPPQVVGQWNLETLSFMTHTKATQVGRSTEIGGSYVELFDCLPASVKKAEVVFRMVFQFYCQCPEGPTTKIYVTTRVWLCVKVFTVCEYVIGGAQRRRSRTTRKCTNGPPPTSF